MLDPSLLVAGFCVGALVGLTGVGGGALMTPVLILLFGVRPTVAVGTDLAYAAITKLAGTVGYLRRREVNFPYVRWLIVGSVPASVLTVTFLVPRLDAAGVDLESLTTRTLGLMLLAVSVVTLAEPFFYNGALRDSRLIRSYAVQKRFKEPILVVGGCLVGIGVGLTSVGSGAVLLAVLLLVSELDLLVVIGTAMAHATILVAAAGVAHWVRGNIQVDLLIPLLAGSLPGVWLGTHLAPRVPRAPLRAGVAILLGLTGARLGLW